MTHTAETRYLASRCPTCGAPKSRPSQTAYVYCDFCGSLADYDFRKACETPQQMPGPVYQNLVAALQKKTAAALAAGDRKTYRDLQLKLYEAWVDACPNAVPPRVRDAEYKAAYVANLADAGTVAAFDPQSVALSERMNAATVAIKWITGKPGVPPRVHPDSFAPVLDAVLASLEYALSDAVQSQITPHPDMAPPALQKRMSQAMFVQGWLPYLDEANAKALLERTGLAQEYVTAPPLHGENAACGHCKAAVEVFPGAKRVVCDSCGHQLRVDRRLACDGCGTHLLLDGGGNAVNCPFCQRRLERIAVPFEWPGIAT